RNGQVGEGRAVWLFREILTPFLSGEVAIGNCASDAQPGFEAHVEEHHASALAAGYAGRESLAVGAEGHAPDPPLARRQGVAEPAAPAAVQPHPPAAASAIARGQGLAVGTVGHARDAALAHRDRVAQPAPGDIEENHSVAVADAVVTHGQGLAVWAEGHARG